MNKNPQGLEPAEWEEREATVPCPGNNCGHGVMVTLRREIGSNVAPWIVTYPNMCHTSSGGCGTIFHYTPDVSEEDRRTAWEEAD